MAWKMFEDSGPVDYPLAHSHHLVSSPKCSEEKQFLGMLVAPPSPRRKEKLPKGVHCQMSLRNIGSNKVNRFLMASLLRDFNRLK